MTKELHATTFFDLTQTLAAPLFEALGEDYPWTLLPKIHDFLLTLGASLPEDDYRRIGDQIWIHRTARVAESASLTGPLIVCKDAEIRHCAFIRGNALIGENAVVGNSTELKNVILFNGVQVPHYNYVGDSILGYRSHMGAGAITSNVKSDKTLVSVRVAETRLQTGLKKFGAIIGDYAEIGCGSVLNPGCVIGKNAIVYPLSMVRGYVPADFIYKRAGELAERHS